MSRGLETLAEDWRLCDLGMSMGVGDLLPDRNSLEASGLDSFRSRFFSSER
jgi:hypothetical protein